jgi:hypothetical protein
MARRLAPDHWQKSLVLTRAVIEEAMRLYPSAFVIVRAAQAPDHVAERQVAPGDVVVVSPWILHRHRRLWREPNTFDPGRFLPGAPPVPRYAYLPFGVGPRVCIGAHFALTEALLVMARLVGAFRIELASRQPVLSVAVVTTQPDHAPLYHLSVAEQGCAEGPPVMHPVVLEAAQAVFGAATTNLLRRSCLGRVGQSLGTEAVGERSGLTWRADALVRVTGAENDSDKLVFLRTIRSICSRFVLERDTALRYQLLPLAWTVPSPLERCTTHSRDVNHAAIQLRRTRPNGPSPAERD